MKKIKYIFIPLFVLILLFFSSIKMYSYFNFPEEKLKYFIKSFFKNNLNKAVYFKKVEVSITGNIHIYDFDISTGSDFNDNRNKINTPEAILDVDIINYLNDKPFIKGVRLKHSNILFFKQYGKNYAKSFKNLIKIDRIVSKIKSYSNNKFYINIEDGKILYQEKYRDNNLVVRLEKIKSEININNDNIFIDINGKIIPYKTLVIDDSSFKIGGNLLLSKDNNIAGHEFSMYMKNFDLSYLNQYLKEKKKIKLILHGGLSSNLKVVSSGKYSSINGTIDVNSLRVAKNLRKNTSYTVVNNENFSVNFDSELYNDFKKFYLKKINFVDDNIDFKGSCYYERNRVKKYFEANFDFNEIDLENLSTTVTPFKGVVYSGKLNLNGKIKYNLKRNSADLLSINSNLKDFSAYKIVNGKRHNIVHHLNSELKTSPNSVELNLFGKKNISDFNMNLESFVKKWNPIMADTRVDFKSKLFEMKHIFSMSKRLLTGILDQAYIDKRKGYNEIFFRQRKTGKFINNNNFYFDINIDKIRCGNGADINNGELLFSLKNGYLISKHFMMEGYGATYNMDFSGKFNRDMPTGNFLFEVSNLNLSDFYKDMGVSGVESGLLNLELSYKGQGFRAQHLVNFARANIILNARNLVLNNTPFQENMLKFFNKENNEFDIDRLNISSLSFNLKEAADNYYVRDFSMVSDKINFRSRGRYTYRYGFNTPFYLTAPEFSDVYNKNIKKGINLKLKGELTDPYIIYRKRNSDRLFLF